MTSRYLGELEDASTADSLDTSSDTEPEKGLRRSTQGRAKQENKDREIHDHFSAADILEGEVRKGLDLLRASGTCG